MKHILQYTVAWKFVGVFVAVAIIIGAVLLLVPPTELLAAY